MVLWRRFNVCDESFVAEKGTGIDSVPGSPFDKLRVTERIRITV